MFSLIPKPVKQDEVAPYSFLLLSPPAEEYRCCMGTVCTSSAQLTSTAKETHTEQDETRMGKMLRGIYLSVPHLSF